MSPRKRDDPDSGKTKEAASGHVGRAGRQRWRGRGRLGGE